MGRLFPYILYWVPHSTANPLVQVYYSTNPQQPLSQWESQFVDNNKLTTISDLTPHTIYTIRVEAYTSIGPGPLSNPVQVQIAPVFILLKVLFLKRYSRSLFHDI